MSVDARVRSVIRRFFPAWLEEKVLPPGWRSNGCICWRTRSKAPRRNLGPLASEAEFFRVVDAPTFAVRRVGDAFDWGEAVALFETKFGVFGINEGALPLFDGLAVRASFVQHGNTFRSSHFQLVGVDGSGKVQIIVAEKLTDRANLS